MKRRLKLWMLLALVAGFALIFAGLAAAVKSSSRPFWFSILFGSILGLLISLPVLIFPWIWNLRVPLKMVDGRWLMSN